MNNVEEDAVAGKPRTEGRQLKLRRRTFKDDDDDLRGIVLTPNYELPVLTATTQAKEVGVVNLNPVGFGFVTKPEGGSFFIRAALARVLLQGDEIRFSVNEQATRPEVHRIGHITRAPGLLMCEAKRLPTGMILVSDDPCHLTLELAPEELSQVADGDILAVEYSGYDGFPSFAPIKVRLREIIGPRQNTMDFFSRYAQVKFGFDQVPTESLIDIDTMATAEYGFGDGVDVTPYVTIDGASTQDLDDAIFARQRSDNTWTVRIAISDVSAAVKPSSAIDLWATAQGTSVYLPGQHIPMLPSGLSLDACSLREGVVRGAVVLSLHLSDTGEILERRIERRRIKSAARLTYTQVSKFLTGGSSVRFSGEIEALLQSLESVYNLMAEKRKALGVLDMDEPEPQLVPDEAGGWKLIWEQRTIAHKLVESFMLLANSAAAELLVERYGVGIFRHQESPSDTDWVELGNWAAKHGVILGAKPCLKAMAELISNLSAKSSEKAMLAIFKMRAIMKPAKYVVQGAEEGGGHFSLGVPWYTHFTSPIRRYPDLLTHRLLMAPEGYELTTADIESLRETVAHCSQQSVKARTAERWVWDRIKQQCLISSTPKDEALKARVLRSTAKGVRLVIAGWQCAAWLMAENLREVGYAFEDGVWTASGLDEINDGATLTVCWTSLGETNPANPELQVSLKQ